MSISEQVKELRNIAETFCEWEYNRFYNAISRAADTIESLSAKLQAANIERSVMDYEMDGEAESMILRKEDLI